MTYALPLLLTLLAGVAGGYAIARFVDMCREADTWTEAEPHDIWGTDD